jgi:hypothetical protein
MDIYGELTARKKYGTATLREKSVELGITIHDEDEIEELLSEGEDATMRSKLTEEELDYGRFPRGDWGIIEAGASTGWDSIEDTARANTISIHPDAHLVCETREIAEQRQTTFRRADDQGWTQRHHPNMVIRATPNPTAPAPSSTGDRYNTLTETHV